MNETFHDPAGTLPGTERPLRILVADELPVGRDLHRRMFGRLGYAIDVVPDGGDALRAVAVRPYDVLVLDTGMVRSNAIETARQIRSRALPGGQRLWIIGLGAADGGPVQAAARAAGIDEVLTKPMHPEDLAVALERAFSAVHAVVPPRAAVPAQAAVAVSRREGGRTP